MLCDSIDLPDELVAAQEQGRLAIFVGAGVSMGPPSNLPSFKQLTERIAENTGHDPTEPYDVFLGTLADAGVNVHTLCQTSKDPAQFLPTSVQKSYFSLSRSARAVLDTALRKYRPGRTDLIQVGGIAQLKPALRLMMAYRLVLQDINGAEVFTSYTRWLE